MTNIFIDIFLQKHFMQEYHPYFKGVQVGWYLEYRAILKDKDWKNSYETAICYLYETPKCYIKDITYNEEIHVYPDNSLCLFEPDVDFNNQMRTPSLAFHIVPWIYRWIDYYEYWLVKSDWLGKSIQH